MMKKLFLVVVGTLLMLVFSANFMNFTVNAEAQQQAETVTVTVTSYFDSENHPSSTINDQNYGTVMSVQSNLTSDSDYAFAYWVVNGVVRYDLPIDHQFTLLYDMDITAIFYPVNPTIEYAVLFMDANGDNLDVQYVESGNSATPPTLDLPDKPGYIVSETDPWSVDTSNITGNTVSVLQYEKDTSDTYTVYVFGGTVNSLGSDTFDYNEIATVVADSPGEGEYFHHWEIEDHTVSYSSTYSFTVLENQGISAVYSTETPDDEPMITLSDDLALRTGYKSYLGQFYLPSGYELVAINS